MNNTTLNLTCFFFDINLDKTADVLVMNVLTCILNSLFSLLTVVANVVILHAIRKVQDHPSPSFILLSCLAVSDLLVGAICQPLFVAHKIAEVLGNFSLYCTFRMIRSMFSWTTCGVSALTLAIVSVDRLLALTLHLRYKAIVTVRRMLITVCVVWLVFITGVLLRFSISNWILLPLVTNLLTLIVITLSTFKIFQIARSHQRKINDQNMAAFRLQTNTVNVLKCKTTAVTVLYVYGLFVIFYLPFSVTILVNSFVGYTREIKIALDYTATVVFINSFFNPLIYCWRMREIRRAVKNILRRQSTQ